MEGCKLSKVVTKNEKVTAVETNLGDVECQIFVNSAGMVCHFLLVFTGDPFLEIFHVSRRVFCHTGTKDTCNTFGG